MTLTNFSESNNSKEIISSLDYDSLNSNPFQSENSSKKELELPAFIDAKKKVRFELNGVELGDKIFFKQYANALGLSQVDFFKLLITEFAKHNPKIVDRTTKLVIHTEIQSTESKPNFEVVTLTLDKQLDETYWMITNNTISSKALRFRCDEMFAPYLRKKIPDEQKARIVRFINFANEKLTKGEVK